MRDRSRGSRPLRPVLVVAFAIATSCTPDKGATNATGTAGSGAAGAGGSGIATAGSGGTSTGGGTTTTGSGGGSTGGVGGSGGQSGAGTAGAPTDGAAGDDVVAAGVRWMGRVDATANGGPRFAWSGTGFAATFSGTSIGVNLANDDAYFFQAVVDGKKGERFQVAKGRAVHSVATGLAAGSHTLELTRETEASFGASQFLGVTEATLLTPPKGPSRMLEFVGDSITAAYGNLGNEPHPDYGNPSPCGYTFATQSPYLGYGAATARALGAEASVLAVSGWGVYRSNSSSSNEVLPKVYANSVGLTASPAWDFRRQADAVVINLGTNDFAAGDPGAPYTAALGAFVDVIRSRYPRAFIFCAVGTMLSTAQQQKALSYANTVVQARGGDAGRVAAVNLGTQDALRGTGCDWHPSVAENERMAGILVPAIKQALGW